MKRYIKSSVEKPYLYIFKHGIGPGTLPSDVVVVKTKDLPRGYTAVWTDRFLTTNEMDQYDIPYETEINRYLDRIGYCQKNGDVVPCDDIEACGEINGAIEPNSPNADKTKLVRQVIKQAKEIRDYFQSHNNNLNRKQEQYLEDLSDGIDNEAVAAIRDAIENMKYNSKNLRSEQYNLIMDLYDEFNLSGGKFEGMGYPEDDIETCDKVTAATKPADGQVKFFYKGKFLGACDPEYMECGKLYELLESDTYAATQVLNYMNSLGDPVFPTEDGGYEPETDVSKVNIYELYNLFMQELYYSYRDFPEDFYVGGDYILPDFEIFTGAVAEDVDLSATTKYKADMVNCSEDEEGC